MPGHWNGAAGRIILPAFSIVSVFWNRFYFMLTLHLARCRISTHSYVVDLCALIFNCHDRCNKNA
jgi:hypothetical protein